MGSETRGDESSESGSHTGASTRPEAAASQDRSRPRASRQARGSGASRPQIPGGWVSADHARAERRLARISVEHANRRPDAFFNTSSPPRVYLPTDGVFENGRAQIRSRGGLELSRLANLLALHPERPVVLEVHTDSNGRPDQQQALSQERAEAVLGWLTDRGHLAPSQLQVEGHGGSRPLVPPDGSYAAQEPNRRIEMRLVE